MMMVSMTLEILMINQRLLQHLLQIPSFRHLKTHKMMMTVISETLTISQLLRNQAKLQ